MLLPNNIKRAHGFTLIELLIVITIIGILSGILIMIIKPEKYLSDSRNARRKEEIYAISMAVYEYHLGKGYAPTTITSTKTEICRQGGDCTGLIDLSVLVDEYLQYIPVDSKATNLNGTGYSIQMGATGRTTVYADFAENGEIIEITK